MPRSNRRALGADDLFALRICLQPAMSGDETRVAYVLERMDEAQNGYIAHLRVLDLKTQDDRAFTHGPVNDSQPAWSPDGQWLAFVSKRGEAQGVYVMPAGGGSEREVLKIEGTVQDLQWSPSQKELVFALRYDDAHRQEEGKKGKPPVYRHVTKLTYKADGYGYLPQDHYHIHVLDVRTGGLRKLTRGQRDNLHPKVSPDGRWVAYASNRTRDPDRHPNEAEILLVPLRGGKERIVPTPAGPVEALAWSPDGKALAWAGHDDPRSPWGVANLHVWKVGLRGKLAARDLMPGFDRSVCDQSVTDTSNVLASASLAWSGDGKWIFFLSSDTGATHLYAVPSRGGTPVRLHGGKVHLRSFSVNGAGRTAALVRADPTQPGEIVTCPTTAGGEKKARVHTRHNAFLRTEVRLGRTREVWFGSPDGTRVQGWIAMPPDFKPTRRYPTILQIHGGPAAQYAFTFLHEMQFLAARGYVVMFINPRGGTGRGEAWARAIEGGWGDVDYQDTLAAADWLAAQPFVDAKRMGICGGSYGGYMTNWVIGHTDRFRAAVTQRCVSNLVTMVSTSDVGFTFDLEFPGFPWTNRALYEERSPIHYCRNVKTPLLIVHSEQDLRCPTEQAEQMFVTLKVMGKTVEMVRFPEESHGLSRHGRPDRRIARLEWIERWFHRYLKR